MGASVITPLLFYFSNKKPLAHCEKCGAGRTAFALSYSVTRISEASMVMRVRIGNFLPGAT